MAQPVDRGITQAFSILGKAVRLHFSGGRIKALLDNTSDLARRANASLTSGFVDERARFTGSRQGGQPRERR